MQCMSSIATRDVEMSMVDNSKVSLNTNIDDKKLKTESIPNG